MLNFGDERRTIIHLMISSMNNIPDKKLLVLAGADIYRKVVSAAQDMGVYVIVTDNLAPSLSPAKQIADEYWNISIEA